jgi:hypothetical protein
VKAIEIFDSLLTMDDAQWTTYERRSSIVGRLQC